MSNYVLFDQEIQDEYSSLLSRKQELSARLAEVKGDAEKCCSSLAILVVEGCDIQAECQRLAALRLEGEAIQLGISALSGKRELLKRINSWLKT